MTIDAEKIWNVARGIREAIDNRPLDSDEMFDLERKLILQEGLAREWNSMIRCPEELNIKRILKALMNKKGILEIVGLKKDYYLLRDQDLSPEAVSDVRQYVEVKFNVDSYLQLVYKSDYKRFSDEEIRGLVYDRVLARGVTDENRLRFLSRLMTDDLKKEGWNGISH